MLPEGVAVVVSAVVEVVEVIAVDAVVSVAEEVHKPQWNSKFLTCDSNVQQRECWLSVLESR